jgi:3-hydroxybutyryl-CoA dehydrogenase
MTFQIETVAVVGCGLMGSGIAETVARAGMTVVAREVSDALLERGRGLVARSLARAVEKAKMTPAERDGVLSRIRWTTRLEDLAPADLVVEAIVEDLSAKKDLFRALDAICRKPAVFATNTSSLPVGDLAAATKRPERFVGLHFFNPVPVMKLVEVVRTLSTSDEVFAAAVAFGERIGKVVVRAKDTPGFVVNLLLIPYLLDAVRALESGVATKEDIDAGMKLGCGHPMGPIELLDFVGLDTTLWIADILFHEYKDPRYAAPPMLRRLVAAGRHGRKTGRGFYDPPAPA